MSAKIKTVRLYGKLGARFGRVFHLAVSSPAEAVRALSAMLPGFEAFMMRDDYRYAVLVGKRSVSEQELADPSGAGVIRIAPVPAGSKRGGVLQTIIGVVLFAAGFVTGGATWGPAMMAMGAGLAIGGVMLMLSPQPSMDDGDRVENRPSYVFNGPVNTEAQGKPVPVLYGEMIVGSAVISGGIYNEERA